MNYLPEIHRSLPHSVEAEQGVLASLMIAPMEVSSECVTRIAAEHFHIPAHATIYSLICECVSDHKPIDFISITQILKDRGKLDEVGGPAFVTHLFTYVPTAANVGYYMDILEEKYSARATIEICTRNASLAYEGESNTLETLEKEVFEASRKFEKESSSESAYELVISVMEDIDKAQSRKGEVLGMKTGFRDIDWILDGLHDSEMIVIAARPSTGKTALAMNMVEHIAIEQQIAVGVFSLEMSKRQLMQRMVTGRARVNWRRHCDGETVEHDSQKLVKAGGEIARSPIFFNDKAGISPAYIGAVARRWKRKHGIQAIFIDYLQMVRGSKNYKGDNRQAEVAEVSSGLKGIAKELGIPVIVLAQLSRAPEQRAGGKPRLSDLRESGSIEQDADVVCLLHREEMYAATDDEKQEHRGKATLIIAKQRNGPIGDVPLTFISEYTRFDSRAPDVEPPTQAHGF